MVLPASSLYKDDPVSFCNSAKIESVCCCQI